MESVGEKLKVARDARSCSLDQAARDTHISRRFLEALEEENFSSLPGDSYVVGFLRSYSEYLGLDSVDIVNLYRNLKLQEQPAPMNELIVKTGLPLGFKLVIMLVLAVVLGIGAYLFINSQQPQDQVARVVEVASEDGAAETFVMNAAAVVNTFAANQRIRLSLKGQDHEFFFTYKNNQVQLNLKDGQVTVVQGQETVLDLDADGKMDLKVVLNAVDAKAKPVRFTLALDLVVDAPQTLAITPTQVAPVQEVAYGTTLLASREKKPVAFPEYPLQGEIACRITFEIPVFFRYQGDGGKPVERLAAAGEVLELKAQSRLRLWVANGGVASLTVGSRTIKAGAEGEVVAWELSRLSPELPGQLALIPLY